MKTPSTSQEYINEKLSHILNPDQFNSDWNWINDWTKHNSEIITSFEVAKWIDKIHTKKRPGARIFGSCRRHQSSGLCIAVLFLMRKGPGLVGTAYTIQTETMTPRSGFITLKSIKRRHPRAYQTWKDIPMPIRPKAATAASGLGAEASDWVIDLNLE